MILQKCGITECGAQVLMAEIDGEQRPLNLTRMTVAVPGKDGTFRLVEGYQLHNQTCLDLSARPPRTVAEPA